MGADVLVKFEAITKKFPGVVALQEVSFDVKRGEVHSIVGENGAGKSTLMNILSGVYLPTSGKFYFDGDYVNFKQPLDSQKAGIAMIHQELSVAPKLSVMENIFIGRLKKNKLGLVDYKTMNRLCKQQLEKLENRTIRPDQMVSDLSTSERQIVEIAKALTINAKLIIMDEPTSSLSKTETETLLKIIKALSKQGVSIMFISHRMEEVFSISDRITVLRDGQYIETLNGKDSDKNKIISLMVGREFVNTFNRKRKVYKKEEVPVLEVKKMNSKKLKDINFKLYSGEVLAITGLVGAGRTELVQALFGIEKPTSGEIYVDGKKVKINKPIDAIKMQFGLVPEGRKTAGLFLGMSVMNNMTITILNKMTKGMFIDNKKDKILAEEYRNKLSIKTPSLNQKIKFLSGGNQQKNIIARWLMTQPRVLFLDEPTHGIDIGAKTEIYKIIDSLAKQGVAIVLVSSELPEVLLLADRVIVMRKGEITSTMNYSEVTQEKIMENAIVI
ncbi:sugar ABC transporter ATP-binding protein [Vallitalea guaymasensis]|uniref:sugar ABC transporter ATP-binding protein n=1 Tax=Vallitalea guaymasensis TaxID=1185412 RepID=UPI000DE26131|nr:sugar ABC transporter ATP-binding protein [Vallitalea guaymasensis]